VREFSHPVLAVTRLMKRREHEFESPCETVVPSNASRRERNIRGTILKRVVQAFRLQHARDSPERPRRGAASNIVDVTPALPLMPNARVRACANPI